MNLSITLYIINFDIFHQGNENSHCDKPDQCYYIPEADELHQGHECHKSDKFYQSDDFLQSDFSNR